MHVFKLHRMKSEAPLIAVFAIFSLAISLLFFPKLLWYSFLIFPIMAIAYFVLREMHLGLFKKQCFLILDDTGMRYCFHLFQQARILKWEQVEKVNFQMYEMNFRLKESGEVISLQTSYLEDMNDFEDLKALILEHCKTM